MLQVVVTDATFELIGQKHEAKTWIGKCLHCNRKLAVTPEGSTVATLEHIMPLSAGGSPDDPTNLALACASCNNEKGIHHDPYVGRGGRADEVINSLREKRMSRWRDVKPDAT